MSDAMNAILATVRAHDARYASFAARIKAELVSEAADIARRNAVALYVSTTADTAAATVRPAK